MATIKEANGSTSFHTEFGGLSDAEVLLARRRFGYNEISSSKSRSVWMTVFNILKEPMFILLVSCGTLYMLLGDTGEGLMLLASVILIIVITLYQENKTEGALLALKELSSPRAMVIRQGFKVRIPGREIVPGDYIILQEGDRIPADAFVVECLNLRVDESLLTGESFPVCKLTWNGKDVFMPPSGESLAFVYSGTLVVAGRGIARVHSTGDNAQIGMIGKSLANIQAEPTLLQYQTGRMVRTFAIIGTGLCILLVVIYGITRNDWLHGILSGLSLAMAMIPEEFSVVLTVFLALGAWRISGKNVLTRQPASIETLGSVTVLCADKTGTLTHNKMRIRRLCIEDSIFDPLSEPEDLGKSTHLLRCSMLASQAKPYDPMEIAIWNLGREVVKEVSQLQKRTLVKEYPLSSGLFVMSHAFAAESSRSGFYIAAKGSPEAVFELCKLNDDEKKSLEEKLKSFANDGLRVLGVADAYWAGSKLPDEQKEFQFEFIGLLGFEDPLREDVKENLRECYQAGIRVIMITGDYEGTATSVARQMGLKNPGEVICGNELAKMDDLELREKIGKVNVFARMVPEQKLRLVEVLKSNGEIVGMTGDGVNDAPALKAAHIGIAMGQKGTDVAREAAGMVLVDDKFSSIISSIKMGRRIYDNIKKAMSYIFSVHIPIAGLAFIPVFFPSVPMILFPLHIALMELIIDPASSLVFEGEKEEDDIMRRKPRPANKNIFGKPEIIISSLQGISVLVVCLGVFLVARYLEKPENEVRALTFTSLVISNLALIMTNRSSQPIVRTIKQINSAVFWVVGGAILLIVCVLYIPGLRSVFHFDLLHLHDLLICVAAGALSITWFETLKFFRSNSRRQYA